MDNILQLLHESEFWVAVGFACIMLGLLKLGVQHWVADKLDDRAYRISKEMRDAKKLREQAEKLLADYRKKTDRAEEEAAKIVENAKAEAAQFVADARVQLADQVARRAKMAQDRIEQAENEALNEIRVMTADAAMAAAEQLIAKRLDKKHASDLIGKSIKDLPNRLN